MTRASPPEHPWLSVAMPVHAGERWLGATLDSLAAQDCTGIEVIILDSSEDGRCGDISRGFSELLQICYAHVPPIKSWPAKTNLAVTRARAPHISILHQDDLWLSDRTAAIRAAIGTWPEAAMLLNPSFIVDEEGRSLGLWRCPLPSEAPLSVEQVAKHLLVQNFISMPAPVIRRDAWLQVGGMDEQLWYTADWDLYLKLAAIGPTVYRSAPTTAFRIHGHSLTVSGSRDRADFEAQMRTVLDRHIGLVAPTRQPAVRRRAAASIAVNCSLADAARGKSGAALGAFATILRLGPVQALAYLSDSRIVERVFPRVRARLAGSF